jgi:hypothetical protein
MPRRTRGKDLRGLPVAKPVQNVGRAAAQAKRVPPATSKGSTRVRRLSMLQAAAQWGEWV